MTQPLMKDPVGGADYFLRGFALIRRPGIRAFVLIPLLVNFVLFAGAFYALLLQLDKLFAWLHGMIPEWLSWLDYLLWPLALITVLVLFSFLFSSVANWIAAPFNGLLAEKVEQVLTGESAADTGMLDVVKDIPRTLSREWIKLKYYLPKAIGCLILFLIPVVGQTVAPVLWFLFSAWMMAIQYVDYPFDNHKIDFITMREALKQRRGKCLSFGALVTLFASIPVVNLFVMPVAICGATAMWVDHYRPTYRKTGNP
ncbi:sulfate transporter CysZ [Aeromonas simiae]|uniref:sulfate transporter CysZ n=1 Tax=Aeromonas simiae TaxID=218936 RepID=UPI0005A81816|nr:sulfate transporter CysZ [Aeromonas simiae]MDO2947528.1 sulfate transporter CysZ [Aeromonas simiae]MDO2951619.1 sulfate transporter CysZ [Aeromonas simiae]MDO2955088.1 sulfate transporter CysZ [Aeromonas simiae]